MIRANLGPLRSKQSERVKMGPRNKGLVGHGSDRSCCSWPRADLVESPEKGSATPIFRGLSRFLTQMEEQDTETFTMPARLLMGVSCKCLKVGRLGIQWMMGHFCSQTACQFLDITCLDAGLMQVTEGLKWHTLLLWLALGLHSRRPRQ